MKLIATKMAGKKTGFSKSFREAVPSKIRVKCFEKQPLSRTYKNCPHCAAQVLLAALFCDVCDYNFIASMVSQRHKLLNPPTISEAGDRARMSKVAIFNERSAKKVESVSL